MIVCLYEAARVCMCSRVEKHVHNSFKVQFQQVFMFYYLKLACHIKESMKKKTDLRLLFCTLFLLKAIS